MVKIDKREFNKDLVSYIKKKRNKPRRARKAAPKAKEMDMYYEEKRPSIWSQLFSKRVEAKMPKEKVAEIHEIEEEIEETDQEIQEAEEIEKSAEVRKERLLTRLFRRMKGREREKTEFPEEPEAVPQLDEDVKEILKITFNWINKLPKSKLQEFKSSEDFEKYKLILMKYGLVKEKKE